MTAQLHARKQYVETFSAMYITQDHRQIVILGPRHHYIFQAPPELVRLVQSELHPDLEASFDDFVVAADQSITGHYELVLRARQGGYTAVQAALANSMGMTSRLRNEWTLGGALKGKRYAAGDFARSSDAMTPLNRSYSVTIEEQPSVGEAMARIALTPVTVAADGVLMIASVILFPIFLQRVRIGALDGDQRRGVPNVA